jgi:hypothetical protein
MREFVSGEIQNGITDLSTAYIDFNNAVDYLLTCTMKIWISTEVPIYAMLN